MEKNSSLDPQAICPSPESAPGEESGATQALTDTLAVPRSRRGLLRGAIAGTAAAALASSTALSALAARAEGTTSSDLTEFFNILATGEALFVTFYNQAVIHHEQLGFHGAALNALEAIRAEEEIHREFALAHGGTPATTHFSFPHGAQTFQNRRLFLQTQQLAEELTNGALLAWINDMASMGQVRFAQIGGQLMQVEGGHRVVGRVLLGAEPWDNWAFGPVTVRHFADVPAAVTKAGFLSPRPGNDFEFHPVSPAFPGVINTHP
ncbi:MAG TPA: hypothetical protein VH540_25885 [Ktedonobacterales bacterium]|jgi:hypothetical protein